MPSTNLFYRELPIARGKKHVCNYHCNSDVIWKNIYMRHEDWWSGENAITLGKKKRIRCIEH